MEQALGARDIGYSGVGRGAGCRKTAGRCAPTSIAMGLRSVAAGVLALLTQALLSRCASAPIRAVC